MQTYLGRDLLDGASDILYGSDGFEDEQVFDVVLLGGGTGAVAADQPKTFPRRRRSFLWVASNAAEIAALRSFMARGPVPFWLPTWTRDVELTSSIGGGATSFTIRKIGYSGVMFQRGDARRFFYFYGGGSGQALKATSAVDNGNGTETIGVNGTITKTGFPLVCYLLLVRLAGDLVEMETISRNYLTAKMSFVEVPNEAT